MYLCSYVYALVYEGLLQRWYWYFAVVEDACG